MKSVRKHGQYMTKALRREGIDNGFVREDFGGLENLMEPDEDGKR